MLKIKNDNNKNFQKYISENIFEKIKHEYAPLKGILNIMTNIHQLNMLLN